MRDVELAAIVAGDQILGNDMRIQKGDVLDVGLVDLMDDLARIEPRARPFLPIR
jgi:translation initiation factor IF-1